MDLNNMWNYADYMEGANPLTANYNLPKLNNYKPDTSFLNKKVSLSPDSLDALEKFKQENALKRDTASGVFQAIDMTGQALSSLGDMFATNKTPISEVIGYAYGGNLFADGGMPSMGGMGKAGGYMQAGATAMNLMNNAFQQANNVTDIKGHRQAVIAKGSQFGANSQINNWDDYTNAASKLTTMNTVNGSNLRNNNFLADFGNSVSASAQGADAGTNIGGVAGGIIGGVVGGVSSAIGSLIGRKKADDAAESLNYHINDANWRQGRDLRNQGTNINMNMANKLNSAYINAFGGNLNTQGSDFTNGLIYIDNGGTHEQNPNQGVLMGIDPQGIPNLVEEGETIYNDYVYSNRLYVPDSIMKKYKLGGKITFAEATKKLTKESEERPNDVISNRGKEYILQELKDAQEEIKQKREMRALKRQLSKMSPEEQAMLASQLQGQAMPEQQAMPMDGMQGIPQEAMQGQGIDPSMQEGIMAYGGPVNKFDGEEKGSNQMYYTTQDNGFHPNTYVAMPSYALNKEFGDEVKIPDNNDYATWDGFEYWDKTKNNYVEGYSSDDFKKWFYGLNLQQLNKYYNPTTMSYFNKAQARIHVLPSMDYLWKYAHDAKDEKGGYGDLHRAMALAYKDYLASRVPPTPQNNPATNTGASTTDTDSDEVEPTIPYIDTSEAERLRRAPVLGAMAAYADALRPADYSNADNIYAAANRAGLFDRISFNPIGDYMVYNPYDLMTAVNEQNAAANNTIRGIYNNSALNRGQAIAGALAQGYNSNIATGKAIRTGQEYNDTKAEKVKTFNKDTNKFNAEGIFKAQQSNQSAQAQAETRRLQGITTALQLREQIAQARANAIATSRNNIFDNLGNIGIDMLNRADRNRMVQSNIYGTLPDFWGDGLTTLSKNKPNSQHSGVANKKNNTTSNKIKNKIK